MTDLERLALQVSARLTGDDLVLVLEYAAALRIDVLREVMAALSDPAYHPWPAETVLRQMIEGERRGE